MTIVVTLIIFEAALASQGFCAMTIVVTLIIFEAALASQGFCDNGGGSQWIFSRDDSNNFQSCRCRSNRCSKARHTNLRLSQQGIFLRNDDCRDSYNFRSCPCFASFFLFSFAGYKLVGLGSILRVAGEKPF